MRFILIALAALTHTCAFAQVDLQRCARIENDTARLACYDELAKATQEAFGLRNSAEPAVTTEGAINDVTVTVTSATHSPFTGWIVGFDNGHTWKQIGTDSFVIRVGETCTISRAVINSFRLQCGDRERRIRVERIEGMNVREE